MTKPIATKKAIGEFEQSAAITSPKHADPFAPRILTRLEIEALRQHKRQCHEEMVELLKTMDLSRLKC